MAKVFALFKELDEVVGAVDALKASRFETKDIELLSSIPYPPHALGLPETRTQNQAWLSTGMGVVGTLFGFLLAGGTAWLYQLPTGGKPIIAMPSVTKKGISRIVPMLNPGAGVVTTRGHVQWVVTEHGVANLYGKGLQERAKLLIGLAAPEHREALERAYHERFFSKG